MSVERFRIFRAEKTYSVNVGKWYFELMVRKINVLVLVKCKLLQRQFPIALIFATCFGSPMS